MASKLLEDFKSATKDKMSVISEKFWTDSTVVVYWLNEPWRYKQFRVSRVSKDGIRTTEANGSMSCLSKIPHTWAGEAV